MRAWSIEGCWIWNPIAIYCFCWAHSFLPANARKWGRNKGSKFIDWSRYVYWWTAILGWIICSFREHFFRLFCWSGVHSCWNEDFSKFRNKSFVPGFATLDLINLTLEMHRYSQWRGACTGLQWKGESELGERPNLVSMQIRINLENFDLVDTLELLKRSFADLILLTTSNLERKVFLKPCPLLLSWFFFPLLIDILIREDFSSSSFISYLLICLSLSPPSD